MGRFQRALHQSLILSKVEQRWTPDLLLQEAQRINHIAFGDELDINFPITRDMRSTTKWGACFVMPPDQKGVRKVTKIQLCATYEMSDEHVLSVLAHELAHALQAQRGEPVDHGPGFVALRDQIRSVGLPCSHGDQINDATLADKSKIKKSSVSLIVKLPSGDAGAFSLTKVQNPLTVIWNAVAYYASRDAAIYIVVSSDPFLGSLPTTLRKGMPRGSGISQEALKKVLAEGEVLFKAKALDIVRSGGKILTEDDNRDLEARILAARSRA